ncbi:MAG: hypothetical protein PHC80_09045 [Eubacteriales bacterium]|nr:hypothetical protein [Eubacteriales bacterium]
MKAEKEERAKLTGAAVITIVTILACCAVYFFGSSGFGKEAAAQPPVSTPLPAAAYVGAFEEAIEALPYTKQAPGGYTLHDGDLPDITVRLAMEGYVVKTMTLDTQLPILPDAPAADAPILENRLYAKRKEYFEAQRAWLSESIPVLIRAMDPAGRLSDADIYDLTYYAILTVETRKRQDKTIEGFRLRAYADETAEPQTLCVTVQDEQDMAEKK